MGRRLGIVPPFSIFVFFPLILGRLTGKSVLVDVGSLGRTFRFFGNVSFWNFSVSL